MSWLKQAVGFATFSFILMVIFVAMSEPYEMILTEVENQSQEYLDQETVDVHISPFLTTLRTVFGLLFVLSMFSLVVGIFLKAHEDEYEEYPEQFRRM